MGLAELKDHISLTVFGLALRSRLDTCCIGLDPPLEFLLPPRRRWPAAAPEDAAERIANLELTV